MDKSFNEKLRTWERAQERAQEEEPRRPAVQYREYSRFGERRARCLEERGVTR